MSEGMEPSDFKGDRRVRDAAMAGLGVVWGWMTAFLTWLLLKAPTGEEQIFPHADKVWHVAAFGLMTAPLAVALPARYRWAVAGGFISFAGGVEVMQSAMALGRTASVADFLAGMAGVMAAAAAGPRVRAFVLHQANSWAARSAK